MGAKNWTDTDAGPVAPTAICPIIVSGSGGFWLTHVITVPVILLSAAMS
jgi:hypothetical protein